MSSSDSKSVDAVIESVVHGTESVLSFRQLSTFCNISLRDACKQLSIYAAKATDLTVLYHVTTKSKTTLTTTRPDGGRVKVWAIAPKSIALSPTVWMNGDRESMLQAAAEPSHQPNALRDGRHLPIHSVSAAWDTRMDPRFAGQQTSSSATNARKASGLLNAVKLQQKRTSAATASQKAKRSKTGLSVNGSHREANNQTNSKTPSTPEASQQSQGSQLGPSKSLFSSKRLGQGAEERMKAKQKTTTSRKNIKKRRITCDDDDDDDEENKENEKNAVEDDDKGDVDSDVEMERRALERERKEADERAEVEQELIDLTHEVADEPESPELKDVDEVVVVEQDAGVKRSFRETFGLPEQTSGTRRIRKEVEVTVEENGYLVTRREMKTFDEHGNEIETPKSNEDENKVTQKGNDSDKENDDKVQTSCMPSMMTGTPKAKRPHGQQKEAKAQQSGSAGPASKAKGQKGSASKKSKKVKGNIMSYFGKK